MRLFVALLLERPLLEALAGLQSALRRVDAGRLVRWVDPASMHLTLQFLGEVTAEVEPALAAALEGPLASARAPVLGLTELGAFPDWRRPRVVWAGLEEVGDHLAVLHAGVTGATRSLGWEPEARPFQPHLTLGRRRDERGRQQSRDDDLWKSVRAVAWGRVPPVPHRRVALMQSHLGPGGARYEARHRWELPRGP